VSTLLTTHQQILSYLVRFDGMEDFVKE